MKQRIQQRGRLVGSDVSFLAHLWGGGALFLPLFGGQELVNKLADGCTWLCRRMDLAGGDAADRVLRGRPSRLGHVGRLGAKLACFVRSHKRERR